MESKNYTITVDLSIFFSDYRSRIRIFINENIQTIKDITDKLVALFGIDNFHLTSGNEYLPPSEDIRILKPNEVLCAIPAISDLPVTENTSNKKAKKRKSHKLEENSSEPINFHNYSEKKKKKLSLYTENDTDVDNIANPSNRSNNTTSNTKKKKNKTLQLEQEFENENNTKGELDQISENKISTEKSLSNEYSSKVKITCENSMNINEEQNSTDRSKHLTKKILNKGSEYKCKGDLTSYVKKSPIPTITHEYLSEKKVNIVKIDVINKSTQPSFTQTSNSEMMNLEDSEKSSAGNFPLIISGNCESSHKSNLEIPIAVQNNGLDFPITDKNNSAEATESNKINSLNDNNQQQEVTPEVEQKDSKSYNPKRKFFFFDSTILTPLGKNEGLKQSDDQRTENQMYKQKYFTLKSPYISPPKIMFKHQNHEEKKEEKIESTPTKNDNADQKVKQNESSSDIVKHDSCDISGLLSTNDDSSVHKSISGISGFHDLPSSTSRSFVRPKQITGIGHLLEELKSQHSSPYSTLEESECSEFITKRKRKRVRKRKNPKLQQNVTTEIPISTSSNYSEVSLNTKASPSVHIKFEYDNENDNNIKVVDLKDQNITENKIETINITSDLETSIIKESDILKAPIMTDMLPKMGDIIAFKILRMTEDYTPEVSDFITGKVVKLEDNNLVFDIISGLDQCQNPSGKFSVENGGTKNGKNVCANAHVSFNWENLICPRLLFP